MTPNNVSADVHSTSETKLGRGRNGNSEIEKFHFQECVLMFRIRTCASPSVFDSMSLPHARVNMFILCRCWGGVPWRSFEWPSPQPHPTPCARAPLLLAITFARHHQSDSHWPPRPQHPTTNQQQSQIMSELVLDTVATHAFASPGPQSPAKVKTHKTLETIILNFFKWKVAQGQRYRL